MAYGTTVRVSKSTLALLEEYKERFNASTYEEVIRRLIDEHRRRVADMYFGVDRGRLSRYVEEDRVEDRPL